MPIDIRDIPDAGPGYASASSDPQAGWLTNDPVATDWRAAVDAVQALMARIIADGGSDVDRGRLDRLMEHHFAVRGGEVRTLLTVRMAEALRLDGETATILAAATELLHNASLIHDDLQDGDTDRRGAPALWVAFGPASALCAGDALIAAAFRLAATVPDPTKVGPIVTALSRAIDTAVRGQLVDIDGPCGAPLPLARYRALVAAKSGALLALPIYLPLIAAGRSDGIPRAEETVIDLALAYQIADDLADVGRDGRAVAANAPSIPKGISILDVDDLAEAPMALNGVHAPTGGEGAVSVQVAQAAAVARHALDRVQSATQDPHAPIPWSVLAPVVHRLRQAISRVVPETADRVDEDRAPSPAPQMAAE